MGSIHKFEELDGFVFVLQILESVTHSQRGILGHRFNIKPILQKMAHSLIVPQIERRHKGILDL